MNWRGAVGVNWCGAAGPGPERGPALFAPKGVLCLRRHRRRPRAGVAPLALKPIHLLPDGLELQPATGEKGEKGVMWFSVRDEYQSTLDYTVQVGVWERSYLWVHGLASEPLQLLPHSRRHRRWLEMPTTALQLPRCRQWGGIGRRLH